VLYATSRKGEDLGLSPKDHQAIYHPLDISSSQSINSLVKAIKDSKHAPVSVLINNAGVNLDDQFSPQNAKTTLDVNYRGTLNVCQAFIPFLADDGRIVNLSSVGSSLNPYSEQKAQKFRTISTLSELEALMQEYETAVSAGKEGDGGFPSQKAYSVSKASVNSFTKILAKDNAGLTINCCCPGWVNTDMGSMMGLPPKKPEDGARIPIKLAFDNLGGTTGRYWANDSIRSKETGRVQEW